MLPPPTPRFRAALPKAILLWLWLLLFLPVQGAFAELNVPQSAPPQGFPASITAKCDEPVQIRLRSGALNETPKFRIRTQPRLGTLSQPKVVSEDTAVVVYTPKAGVGAGEDSFTFSVQTSQGVSVPAEIKIRLMEKAPLLVVSEEADFGRVLIGKTEKRSIELANWGGGIIEGTMTTKGDFQVEGDGSYHLGAGEKKSAQVLFTPSSLGKTSNAIVYSSHPDRQTTLEGEGVGPIRAVPKDQRIWPDPKDGSRSGRLTVFNQTGQPQKVEVLADSRLKLPANLEIPPGQSVPLEFKVDPSSPEAIDGSVEFRVSGFVEKAHLRIGGLGPIFKATPQMVQFGRVSPSHPASKTLVVENAGGTRGTVSLRLEGPFKIETPKSEISLEPGASESLQLVLSQTGLGKKQGAIVLTSNEGTLNIPIEATVAEGEPISQILALPGGAEGSDSGGTEPTPVYAKALKRIRVTHVGRHDCEMVWDALPGAQYHLELARVFADPSGKPQIAWETLEKNVQLAQREDLMVAEVTGLTPGAFYNFRAEGRDASGNIAERTEPVIIGIPSRSPLMTPLRILVFVLLVIAGLVARERWKRR